MTDGPREKRALQIVVAAASLVPIGAGIAGVILGPWIAKLDPKDFPTLDSHFRYLSGLLLGIGIAYLSLVRGIEREGQRFRLLTAIVVAGGIGRLISRLATGAPSHGMQAALLMELVVTPALALWQHRVAIRSNARNKPLAA